jgi:hypothetical protein
VVDHVVEQLDQIADLPVGETDAAGLPAAQLDADGGEELPDRSVAPGLTRYSTASLVNLFSRAEKAISADLVIEACPVAE